MKNKTYKPVKPISLYEVKNNPLARLEKWKLQKCLMYGKIFPYRVEFSSKEHKLIYSNLESFLHNFPCEMYTGYWFLSYLQETGAINICGGIELVRGIFADIGEQYE
jgi:hypothetical protein